MNDNVKKQPHIALFILPLVAFFGLVGFLAFGLWNDPKELPSVLVGKPFPDFQLESLQQPERQLTVANLQGKAWLVNVWATWCPSCRHEHGVLNALAKEGVPIIGINYKDERQAALEWLSSLGNPYVANIYDVDGSLAIDLGVYGAPETFLVDAQGIIRHRFAGPIDQQIWREQLKPIWDGFSQQTP